MVPLSQQFDAQHGLLLPKMSFLMILCNILVSYFKTAVQTFLKADFLPKACQVVMQRLFLYFEIAC